MSSAAGNSAERQWAVEISCPRPRPRVRKQQQAWHLEAERMQRTVSVFLGADAAIKLTSATVHLRCSFSSDRIGQAPDRIQDGLGEVLSCLYFDVQRSGTYGPYQLPRPVRV
ncbi:hypothetical protein, partial [Streptomyces sp. NPDC005877]|uniref:hypothetical protein n=1 Tax=Streptomyces sp. NPDC005877 TaxID=3155346 RepID=UPI0033E3E342